MDDYGVYLEISKASCFRGIIQLLQEVKLGQVTFVFTKTNVSIVELSTVEEKHKGKSQQILFLGEIDAKKTKYFYNFDRDWFAFRGKLNNFNVIVNSCTKSDGILFYVMKSNEHVLGINIMSSNDSVGEQNVGRIPRMESEIQEYEFPVYKTPLYSVGGVVKSLDEKLKRLKKSKAEQVQFKLTKDAFIISRGMSGDITADLKHTYGDVITPPDSELEFDISPYTLHMLCKLSGICDPKDQLNITMEEDTPLRIETPLVNVGTFSIYIYPN